MRWPTHVKIAVALLGLLVGQLAPIYALVAGVNALSDTTPVAVQSFTRSASTVTVDTASAQVTLQGLVSDDLSGFASMQVYYTSPSGKQVVEGQIVNSTATSFEATATFPRYSEPGVWVPTATFMDTATNVLTLTPQELTAKGFSLNVTVNSSTPDTTAPVLTAFSVGDSSSISVVNDWALLQTDITLTDDLSGVARNSEFANATIKYVSPNGQQSYSGSFETTQQADEYTSVIQFPQHVEAGIWQAQLTAVDAAGNTRVYDANDLTNLGFTPSVTIASEPDTTPVSVTSLAFMPLQQDYYDSFYDFTGGPVVTMQLKISDDYAGVSTSNLRYRSVTTSQVVTAVSWSQYNDNSTEILQFMANLPLYAASGDWLPELSTIDQAGNTKTYSYNDLLALGFDMKVTVGDNVTESVGAGDTVTTDVLGAGATQSNPVQATVTSPVPGNVSVTAVDTASTEGDFTGYSLLPQQYSISAPAAEPENPLVLAFTVDSSQLSGISANDLTVFRDGTAVGECLGSTVADPDPCVKSLSTDAHGDVTVTVNSSHASQWVFGTKKSTQTGFTFRDFKKPVLAAPTLNKQQSGSAIPVKFSIGGDYGLNVLEGGVPTSQRVDCVTMQSMGDSIATLSTNGDAISLGGDGYYRYNWKTLKDWKGTCRQFTLTFTTGETASALFKFN